MADNPVDGEIRMSAGNLYREETYTDRQVGSLQILTPVKKDGSTDFSRQRLFVGQTQAPWSAWKKCAGKPPHRS